MKQIILLAGLLCVGLLHADALQDLRTQVTAGQFPQAKQTYENRFIGELQRGNAIQAMLGDLNPTTITNQQQTGLTLFLNDVPKNIFNRLYIHIDWQPFMVGAIGNKAEGVRYFGTATRTRGGAPTTGTTGKPVPPTVEPPIPSAPPAPSEPDIQIEDASKESEALRKKRKYPPEQFVKAYISDPQAVKLLIQYDKNGKRQALELLFGSKKPANISEQKLQSFFREIDSETLGSIRGIKIDPAWQRMLQESNFTTLAAAIYGENAGKELEPAILDAQGKPNVTLSSVKMGVSTANLSDNATLSRLASELAALSEHPVYSMWLDTKTRTRQADEFVKVAKLFLERIQRDLNTVPYKSIYDNLVKIAGIAKLPMSMVPQVGKAATPQQSAAESKYAASEREEKDIKHYAPAAQQEAASDWD